ncbi:MAG TPA: caspase family protein [Saprospiraceae bacterium]|nr:caspase family protein [Saprospiraceae bacterium]
MAKRTLYSVLAGINEYPPPVTPLRGCMHDVDVWQGYLTSEESEYTLELKILRNQEVTKQELTDAFRTSLINARSGDIVFFFYSGHGTRETADPVFSEIEQDNALESLVCHDSIKYTRGNFEYDLLSDKEIHYLISTHGREDSHILTIFDCCHSGGITRNMLLSEMDGSTLERRHVPTERLSFIAPMRRWQKFLFGDTILRDQVEVQGWMHAVPQRRHLTLSACQNDESAFEQSGKGIFTVNMMDVLRRSGGALSYYDLQSRVRLFTQNQFRQTPEIYAVRGYENDLLRTFLDKAVVHKDFRCTCYFKKELGWVIDLGAIHGISSYSGPVEIRVGDRKYNAPIEQVFAHYSKLNLSDDSRKNLQPEEAYRASVKSHFSGNTSFYPEAEGDALNILAQLCKDAGSYIDQKGSPFTIADVRAHAGYLIRIEAGNVRICHNDDGKRPVTEISLSDPDALKKTLQYMRHIAQWEYIKTLCNPDFVTKEYPVEFTIYQINPDGSKKELSLQRDTLEFEYAKNADGDLESKMKVRLTNKSSVKYYCAILYLSNEFQVYGNMLDGKVIGLNPSETAWIYNGGEMELDLEQHVVDFNYAHSVFYLKLLANPDPFQVDTLEQSALPAPAIQNRRGAEAPAARGIKTREENEVQKAQWFTHTLCFKGRNPYYQETRQ